MAAPLLLIGLLGAGAAVALLAKKKTPATTPTIPTTPTTPATGTPIDCQTLAKLVPGGLDPNIPVSICTQVVNAFNAKNVAALQALATQVATQFPLLAKNLVAMVAALGGSTLNAANAQCAALATQLGFQPPAPPMPGGVPAGPTPGYVEVTSLPPTTCTTLATALAQKDVAVLTTIVQQLGAQFPMVASSIVALIASWTHLPPPPVPPVPVVPVIGPTTGTDCQALATSLGAPATVNAELAQLPPGTCTQLLAAVQSKNISQIGMIMMQLGTQYPALVATLTTLIQSLAIPTAPPNVPPNVPNVPPTTADDCTALAAVAPAGMDANVPPAMCTAVLAAIQAKNEYTLTALGAASMMYPILYSKISLALSKIAQGTA